MTTLDQTPSWNNCMKGRQGWDLDAAEMIDGHAVRITIHHDTSYAFQSHAKAEVWVPETLTWNPLASVLPEVWATATKPERSGGTEGMFEAADELRARARALLSLVAR